MRLTVLRGAYEPTVDEDSCSWSNGDGVLRLDSMGAGISEHSSILVSSPARDVLEGSDLCVRSVCVWVLLLCVPDPTS